MTGPVEYRADDIRLVDISEALPRHPAKQYARRRGPVRSVTVHHTGGGMTPSGPDAVVATAAFCAREDDPQRSGLQGRGWPGMAYTFYVPYRPEVHHARLTIYRCQMDNLVTYHAGPWNAESVSVAFQGSFDHWLHPSRAQEQVWLALTPYLCDRYGIDAAELWPHGWRGKPSCPGPTITSWLRRQRCLLPGRIGANKRRQREAVAELLGWPEVLDASSDPTGLGLRAAVKAWQRTQTITDQAGRAHPALLVDGLWGPATESLARRELRRRGMIA